MYFVCLCPEAKIFQTSGYIVHKKNEKGEQYAVIMRPQDLVKNPDLISLEEDFTMSVNTSQRDHLFRYAAPKLVPDIDLANWIGGGDDGLQVQESDKYGIVKLEFDPDELSAINLLAVDETRKPSQSFEDKLKKAKEKAKTLSRYRVFRQINKVYNHLINQYQLNDEMKQGRYMPSPVEFLCSYILADQKTKESEETKALTERFTELLKAASPIRQ